MQRPFLALLLLAAACGNSDNVILGSLPPGANTPDVFFDSLGSSIHGLATLRDAAGNPTAAKAAVVIMSDRPNLCDRLKATPDYFRNAPEPYEALIMMVPVGQTTAGCPAATGVRLGTFVVGRQCDEGTQAEVVAVGSAQATTPFSAVIASYVALTDWPDGDGNSTGSFNLGFSDPSGTGIIYSLSGRFKTNLCSAIEGTLLP